MTVEELKLGFDRVEAAQACRNLMGTYTYYQSAMRRRETVALWTNREDCVLMTPWGMYEGQDGISICYLEDLGDRNDEGFQESPKMKGVMEIHGLDTCVLEVAGDGQTARGCWFSPGHKTAVNPETEKAEAEWVWRKYAADFILENGKWKIWKMHIYPLFTSGFYTCWTQYPQPRPEDYPANHGKPLPKENWQLSKESVYPVDQPIVPKAYETYGDLPAFQ